MSSKTMILENEDKIIGFDFQGWPIYKMTIRDILTTLGATFNKDANRYEMENSERLDMFPTILEDDGMGYGVNEMYVSEIDIDNESCHIWGDKETKEQNQSCQDSEEDPF